MGVTINNESTIIEPLLSLYKLIFTLFQLTHLALGLPKYLSDVPYEG